VFLQISFTQLEPLLSTTFTSKARHHPRAVVVTAMDSAVVIQAHEKCCKPNMAVQQLCSQQHRNCVYAQRSRHF